MRTFHEHEESYPLTISLHIPTSHLREQLTRTYQDAIESLRLGKAIRVVESEDGEPHPKEDV